MSSMFADVGLQLSIELHTTGVTTFCTELMPKRCVGRLHSVCCILFLPYCYSFIVTIAC